MTSAVLSTHLQSVLYNMIGVRVRYGYEALVFCTRTVEDVPPSSCDALRADPFARSRNITEGETIVPLMGFELSVDQFFRAFSCSIQQTDNNERIEHD